MRFLGALELLPRQSSIFSKALVYTVAEELLVVCLCLFFILGKTAENRSTLMNNPINN